MISQTFCRLDCHMYRARMTQPKLHGLTGISVRRISELQHGAEPTERELGLLAKALNCHPDGLRPDAPKKPVVRLLPEDVFAAREVAS